MEGLRANDETCSALQGHRMVLVTCLELKLTVLVEMIRGCVEECDLEGSCAYGPMKMFSVKSMRGESLNALQHPSLLVSYVLQYLAHTRPPAHLQWNSPDLSNVYSVYSFRRQMALHVNTSSDPSSSWGFL